MVLEPLPETPTRTRKARRRSLFNVFDEKTQFTTREIKLGMVPMTEEEMKQRRVKLKALINRSIILSSINF